MSDTKTRPAPKAAVILTPAAEQRVADLMAKRIVNGLELIEIDKQNSEMLIISSGQCEVVF